MVYSFFQWCLQGTSFQRMGSIGLERKFQGQCQRETAANCLPFPRTRCISKRFPRGHAYASLLLFSLSETPSFHSWPTKHLIMANTYFYWANPQKQRQRRLKGVVRSCISASQLQPQAIAARQCNAERMVHIFENKTKQEKLLSEIWGSASFLDNYPHPSCHYLRDTSLKNLPSLSFAFLEKISISSMPILDSVYFCLFSF